MNKSKMTRKLFSFTFILSFTFLFLFSSFFLIGIISASSFGYDSPSLPQLKEETFDGHASDFFMPLNTSIFGNFSFNGGWQSGGLNIIDGDIYAQTGYFYNLTSLNITKANLTINDNLYVAGNVGIGTASPTRNLEVRETAANTNAFIHVAGNNQAGAYTFEDTRAGGEAGALMAGTSSAIFEFSDTGHFVIMTDDRADVLSDPGTGTTLFQMKANGNIEIQGSFNLENSYIFGGDESPWNLDVFQDLTVGGGSGSVGNLYVPYGNVGIGTATGVDELSIYAASTPRLSIDSVANGYPGIELREAASRKWLIMNANDDALTFQDNTAPRVVIQQTTGNVGIGTLSPIEPLHIYKATTGADLRLEADGANSVSRIMFQNDANVWTIGVNGVDNDKFVIADRDGFSSNNFLVIEKSSGNVGIGTTTPSGKLHINGSGVLLNITNSTGESIFYVNSTTGNVGIGTASPDALLNIYTSNDDAILELETVNGSKNTELRLKAPDGQVSALSFYEDTTRKSRIRHNAGTDSLEFHTLDAVKMTIDSSGNVGIGTTTPVEKLHVFGNIAINDTNKTFFGNAQDVSIGMNSTSFNIIDEVGSILFHFTGFLKYVFDNDVDIDGDLSVTGIIINDAIYIQASDLVDQVFASANVKQPINLTTTDESNGLSISISNVTVSTAGVYSIFAQPQVTAAAGQSGVFHMWLEKHNTTQWLNVSNSNVELSLASQEEDVIPLIITINLNANEKVRVMGSVSDTDITLDAQTGLSEPSIPSIIFTMYRVGN